MSEFLEKIREELLSKKEDTYQAFMAKLLPTLSSAKLLGVRLPYLKKKAKQLAKEQGIAVLPYGDTLYYEERMLEAFHIAFLPLTFKEKIFWVEKFLPQIDNWAICDSFSKALKLKNQEEKNLLFPFLMKWLFSKETYTQRFSIVMLSTYYLKQEEIAYALEMFSKLKSEEYYVQMALAWAVAEYFCVSSETVLSFLQSEKLSLWVHNKSIQKIKESKKVTQEEKAKLEKLKRKI